MAENQSVTEALLDAISIHVAFDGWSKDSFEAAVMDAGVDMADALAACPRGAYDLAIAYHKRGDQMMLARFKTEDLSDLRYSEKIAALVRFRIEAVGDKEAVRKASALFALPANAGDGAKLIWNTCDLIWNALGDTSDDVNWYTKRATLSGVYGSCVLFWLGDDSEGNADTWAFLDRRIENVMQIEKIKAGVRKNPLLTGLFAAPNWFLSQIKAPSSQRMQDVPGYWAADKKSHSE